MCSPVTWLRAALLRPPHRGRHWSSDPTAATGAAPRRHDSPSMRAFRSALDPLAAPDARTAVLGELSTYWKRDLEDTLDRCINWQDYSISEWKAADRRTAAGVEDFYQHCESWAYALLWYDYLRSAGYGVPAVVAVSEWLRARDVTGSHLDFGSGTGSASIMFHTLGWQSAMAEISMPLLEFARCRVALRGLPIKGYDTRVALPANTYDVVTAIDTFAHVTDVHGAAAALYAAMRPDGYLFANFDVREASDYNVWHLYDQEYRLHWNVRRAGFRQVDLLADGCTLVYQRMDKSSAAFRKQLLADTLRYGPPSEIYWRTRRLAVLGGRRLAKRIWA